MNTVSSFTIRKEDVSNPILRMESQQRAVALISKYRLRTIDLAKLMMTVVLSTENEDMFKLFTKDANENHLFSLLNDIVKDVAETTLILESMCNVSHITYNISTGRHGYRVHYINESNQIEKDLFIKPINELKYDVCSNMSIGIRKTVMFGIQCRMKVDDILLGVVLTSLALSWKNPSYFKENKDDFFMRKSIKSIGSIYQEIFSIS